MAKPKKAEQVEESEQVELITDDFISEPALEQMYAEMGVSGDTAATVHITKILADGNEAKIWKGLPDDYDLLAIAKKYGSGDYRVKLYIQHTTGRMVLKGNKVFPVMLTAEEDARLDGIRKGEVQVAAMPGQPAPSANMEQLVQAIALAMKSVVPPQPANNLGMLKEVAEIVRTLAPQPQAQQQPNIIDLLKVAAEFSRGGRDDDGEDHVPPRNATGMDVFYRLVEKFAPAILNATQAGNPATAAIQAPGSSLDAQPAPVSPIKQPAPKTAEEEAVLQMKLGLNFLVMQAQANNDPATYADMVLDNVPEDQVKQFLTNPNPIAYLAQFDKRVEQFVPWFTELLEAVKEELNAPDGDADTLTGGGKTA